MGDRVTNVIDFRTRRAAAAPKALREVEAYWDMLRDGRLAPDRSELDPRGFASALPQSFLLERIAPGLARIRLSGRHLSDLMGIDVQGLPFTTHFLPDARPAIVETLSAVFEEPAVAHLRLSSAPGIGRQPIEARLVLLPLRDDLGDITRALGCLVAEGPIGRTPRRFDVEEISRQTLIGYARRPGPPREARLAQSPDPETPGEVIRPACWQD
jgi:hypothetical protein